MGQLRRRMRRKIHRRTPNCLSCLVWAALVCAPSGWAAEEIAGLPHVRNLGQVSAVVYRGAEPSPEALRELSGHGVKLIIDLREEGSGTASEQRRAEQLGMRYVNIPLPAFSAPPPDRVRAVLRVLTSTNVPVFLHCRRGKDRTGTAIACYRVQHDGWTNAQALAEAKQYGMSRAERAMRAFVLRFSALPPAALLAPDSRAASIFAAQP